MLDHLFSLYEKYGQADYIGEPVSQIEHMSQAAQLAMKEGYDDEVILAAFFHDIGHICVMDQPSESMNGYGIVSHEKIGANYLRKVGFSERLVRLVENHVQAKRYLTFKYPHYYEALSEASRQTLVFQGGPMNQTEANAFEQDPLFSISLRLRQWDEMAKELNIPVVDTHLLKNKAQRLLNQPLSGSPDHPYIVSLPDRDDQKTSSIN